MDGRHRRVHIRTTRRTAGSSGAEGGARSAETQVLPEPPLAPARSCREDNACAAVFSPSSEGREIIRGQVFSAVSASGRGQGSGIGDNPVVPVAAALRAGSMEEYGIPSQVHGMDRGKRPEGENH